MRIAVDAFGGDNAPDEVIKGAADAVKEYGVEVVLTGDEAKINDLESQKHALEAEAAGDAATDYVRLSEISEKITEIEEELDALYADYCEAESALGALGQQG